MALQSLPFVHLERFPFMQPALLDLAVVQLSEHLDLPRQQRLTIRAVGFGWDISRGRTLS